VNTHERNPIAFANIIHWKVIAKLSQADSKSTMQRFQGDSKPEAQQLQIFCKE
jgi:hypothetical protein